MKLALGLKQAESHTFRRSTWLRAWSGIREPTEMSEIWSEIRAHVRLGFEAKGLGIIFYTTLLSFWRGLFMGWSLWANSKRIWNVSICPQKSEWERYQLIKYLGILHVKKKKSWTTNKSSTNLLKKEGKTSMIFYINTKILLG